MAQSNTLRTSPGPFFVVPFSHTHTPTRQHHSHDTNTRQHPFISTTFCTFSCPIPGYERAWHHFAHTFIANYSNPCRQGQSQGDVPECGSHRLVFDQEQSIQEEARQKRQQQVQQQRTGASRQLNSGVHSTYPTQRITETAPDPTSKTNKAAAITITNLSSIFSWHTTLPPPYGP